MEQKIITQKIAIIGALGRMGINNLKIINRQKELKIVAALDSISHEKIGEKVSSIISDFKEDNLVFSGKGANFILESQAEVCIDFSTPQATCQLLTSLQEKNYQGCYIIGTTGFNKEEQKLIQKISESFFIILSGNFNVGVNVLSSLVEKTSTILKDYDIELIEHHHNQKVDAPSGTAKMLLDSCISGDANNNKKIVNGRDGIIGKREKNEIGMSVVRGGGIIGKHEVHFISKNDQLSLTHNAFHRDAFTSGVLSCIKYYFQNGCKNGLFNMKQILGLDKL